MPAWIRRRSGSIARLALLGALLAAATLGAGGASAQTLILPTIYVNYYADTCAFTVLDDSNNPVTTLAPGTYELQVSTPEPYGDIAQPTGNFYGCDGAISFQITGPNGFSWTTDLSGGDDDQALTTVTLLPSATYTLVDNNDPAGANATFTTLASGAPVDPATTEGSGEPTSLGSSQPQSTSSDFRGALSATVGPHGSVAMSFHGRHVGVLKAGRYRVTVINRSRTSGFILQQINEPYKLLVGIGAVGTHTMMVTLAPGQWLFSPHFTGRKGWFNVVS